MFNFLPLTLHGCPVRAGFSAKTSSPNQHRPSPHPSTVYPLFKGLMTRTWENEGYPEWKLETKEPNTVLSHTNFVVVLDFSVCSQVLYVSVALLYLSCTLARKWLGTMCWSRQTGAAFALVSPHLEKSNSNTSDPGSACRASIFQPLPPSLNLESFFKKTVLSTPRCPLLRIKK